ncbi:AAA family ATPase [Xanthobacter sp. V2C-8]|uniref:AAA family ATPase n=1 Tax=Xanthobacter albus TaxID=3119929 RepID=UPI00372CAC07
MRFLSLGLDRYGRFTDRRLDFDPAARVVVVLGANEAGKTTALAAACDVLFGIEERSRFSFLHDYKSMRLSATVAGADGRTLSFARLKRRQATLVDPQTDAPLPDDMLVPFLGAHDRDAFLAIFGLDQARLREGGAKLLAGGGDLADTLVAAAPGLGRVAALRDEMKAEAAALFNPARAVAALPFYAAVTRYKEADKARQDSELRGEAVARLRADTEEAARACAEARDAEEAALRAANRARAALGPLPEVDAAFPAQARARLDARNRAAEAAAQAAQAAEQAGAARAAVTVDDAVLARADDIARRDEERAQVENKLASLPNRRREADAARVGLARIAAGLDLPDVEALRARLPGRPLQARAGTLADGLRAHAARREALEADALSLARRRRDTDSEELPPVADPAPLRRRLEALDGAETRASAAETQGRRLAAAREALAARVARLPFGPWRADDLLRRPLPDHEVAEAALARVADAETAHARAGEQREDLAAQRNQIQARRRVLDGAGTAPTASAIAAAREARDARWRALRPVLLAQRAVLPGDTAEAETFERALAAADRLSDERQTESRRLADLARAELDLAELDARLATAEARVAAAQASLDAAREAWRALWSASGLPAEEASLPVLSDVESIRRDADTLLAQQAETSQQAEVARRDRAEAEALRADLHLPPLGEAPLRMAELRAAVAALETAFQRQRELRRDRERHVRDAAELDARRSTLDSERDALAAEAAEVFPALAIRPGATADEARAALGLWQEAATLHGELATAERRIAGIEQDERAFTQRMEELLGQLEEAASGDLFATVRALRRRVEAALQARTRAEAAQALLAERDAAGDAARATLERAEAGLAEVLARAGVTQPAELPAQLERLEQAARCDGEIAAARQRLDDLRGGRAVEEIRDEIAGRDDEALARHAEDAAAAHDAARQARDAAIVADTRAQEEQKAQAGQAGAAGAAQDMQDAIADLGDAMERFTRAHVAARLLAFAVERYRERHQNPIVTRAAEAFATLTDGRWSGIGIDYDKDPPRLAAIRDGRLHGVDALSEGTADQLFLALRVAAIEEHARRATPLPFLADDLFVSFDEGRTEAGMRLLAGLGAVTQVIVFTHHAHVAECATRALGREASVIRL